VTSGAVNQNFTVEGRTSHWVHGRPAHFAQQGHYTFPPPRPTMSDNKESNLVRIDLTPEQKEQVKAATD
jgi:hypothetical protein